MHKRSVTISLFTIMLIGIFCGAASAGYSDGGGFTAPGYGARAWAMGGAVVAMSGNEGSAFWNPAMLGLLDNHRVGLSYINLIPGVEAQQSYLAYGHVVRRGVVNEENLAFAEHAAGAIYGNLSLKLSDDQKYTENTLRLAYAYSPGYFISVGVSLTFLFSSSDVIDFGSTGTAGDIGLRLALTPSFTLGAVMRNAFSQLEYDDGITLSLPRSFTLGVAYQPDRFGAVEADIVAAHGGISKFVIGGESQFFADILALRAGISARGSGQSRIIPHFGFGVVYRRISLDYNADFDSDDAFDDTHRFSLGIGL